MKRAANQTRGNGDLESQIRRKIEQLTYLPASAAVAVKFIEIGKDPDAGPQEYSKVISSDTSLSTKILALANSSWFGVRNKVSKLLNAITLLGLANVRTLSMSYCMAGVYNHLKLKREDVTRYWQASLCKGVAAKSFALALDKDTADEAFLAGLFQDMAIPLIHSVDTERVLAIVQNPDFDIAKMLDAEHKAFSVDHTEVGRWLGTKLELPEAYLDAVAFHHDAECLAKFIESDVLATAIRVASLFPHFPGRWHEDDIRALGELLTRHAPEELKDVRAFMDLVQKEFDNLFGFFENGASPELRLEELMPDAMAEMADSTTHVIGQMQGMLNEAARTGTMVQNLATENEKLADQTRLDPLTGVLNRAGFLDSGTDTLKNAMRYATPCAVAFLDFNGFKTINDTHGHTFGDFILREFCARVREKLRKGDLFGRIGGDEFVLFLGDLPEAQVRKLIDSIVRGVSDEPFVKGKTAVRVGLSVGVLLIPPSRQSHDLSRLLEQADELMYRSKRGGTKIPCFATWDAVASKSK